MTGNRTGQPGHPAPERGQVAGWRVMVALFGAPFAWMLQMTLSDPLISHACHLSGLPPAAAWPGRIHAAMGILSAACAAIALLSAAIAYRAWRETRQEGEGGAQQTVEVGEGRTRFLFVIGVMTSLGFLVALAFTSVTLLLMSTCEGR